ncbi:hypothetical protein GGR53DRAFT_109590 [Hypoxylon sp. FL1150]|nr:hypothetical protein GGR53DRAFT_109590 [Hypoxylon sp. FL1150]
MASLLLRMGWPDDAEEMSFSQGFHGRDVPVSTGSLRFSGAMVLMSRIRLEQGRVTLGVEGSRLLLEAAQEPAENVRLAKTAQAASRNFGFF